jgi:hypothetical protein
MLLQMSVNLHKRFVFFKVSKSFLVHFSNALLTFRRISRAGMARMDDVRKDGSAPLLTLAAEVVLPKFKGCTNGL